MRPSLPIVIALAAANLLSAAANAQNSTDPPQGQRAVLIALGKGSQIYTCQLTNGTPQWIFKQPEAILYSADSAEVGTHGAGPLWTSKDGSSVKGEVITKAASPEAGAIPWLLLKAASTEGTGILTKVEFIRRSDTHGGIASTTGCDAQHLNAVSRIPYSATYTFYSASPEE
ncbi:MAG TPA: DUF3455 domain-containing protein [Edaphobacter sp.]